MAYRQRVFCASQRRPPRLADLLTWAGRRDQRLWLDRAPPVDPNRPGWKEAAIRYQAGRWPFLLEAKYANEQALQNEVDRFIEIVHKARFGLRRQKVVNHLRRTRMLVSVELPSHDANDSGDAAVAVAVDFFVTNYAGLVQVDGEGFYGRRKLLLKLD